jgi:hypothetical protein
MWISLTISDFWDFCRNLKISSRELIKLSELPNDNNADIWIELDGRYSQLTEKFNGPVFLSHIKKIVPLNQDAKTSVRQLIATFPYITNYLRE